MNILALRGDTESQLLRVSRRLSCLRTWVEVSGGAKRCVFWILSLWRRCAVGDWDRVSGGWTHSLLETAGGACGKEPTRKCRSPEFHSWVGGIPSRRAQQPLQPSCLENPTDRGAWWATVHGVAEIRLKRPSRHTSFVAYLPSLMWLQEAPS